MFLQQGWDGSTMPSPTSSECHRLPLHPGRRRLPPDLHAAVPRRSAQVRRPDAGAARARLDRGRVGRVEARRVAELVARPNSKITKKQVRDLKLPKDITLGGLIRDGKPMMIDGDTHIQSFDHVVVFCLDTAMRKVEEFFN